MPPKFSDRRRETQTQRADSRSNIVGKFTTSVKKLVQDVEYSGDNTRDGAIETSERLRSVQMKVNESYKTVKCALTSLHDKYNGAKSEHNLITRYNLLKTMIKEVIQLDIQYWVLVDVPKQDKQEHISAFVMRACNALEKASEARDGGKAPPDEDAKERKNRYDGLSIRELEEENNRTINDFYRLLKKYSSLRNIVHQLKVSYESTKMYPIIPRYTLLKEMIKDARRDPNYMEVCHEDTG